MATIPQYVKVMRDLAWDVGRRLGADLSYEPKPTRTALLSVLAVQAVLIDTLVKKGVITDTDLVQAVNAVRSSPWSPEPEPVSSVPWETTPVTGV